MTTATKEGEGAQLAALQEARERLEEARQERAVKDRDARGYSRVDMQARAEYERLARSEPEQFGEDGQPKPKTDAAKLKRQVDDAKTSRLPEMVKGADERVAELEAEVRRLTAPLATELARAEYEAGLEAKAEALVIRDQLLAVIGKVNASHPALLEIATATRGALDGSHVVVDPRWQEVGDLLRSMDEFEPVRVPAITPYEDEDPIFRRTADDSWMDVHYDPKAGWHEEQPEPVERPA
jgi:hypothetical protein